MAVHLRCECGQEVIIPEGTGENVVYCPCGRSVVVPPPAPADAGEPYPGLQPLHDEVDRQSAEVLVELKRLQDERPGWLGAIVMLVVSLLLYTGAAQAGRAWDGILILIPVLFFHELGHYVTMRAYGYRNLRMFFIPFFGAAVSGQHYNVAGWKKALVALAGPVPGIAIGAQLGVAGLMLDLPKMVEVAVLMLILNGLNLLPLLPLDGGRVLHAVLFVRHPVMDAAFRVIAALGLLALAASISDWLLIGLAVAMLLTVPLTTRLAFVAHRLRREGLNAVSADADSIPTRTAFAILAALKPVLPAQSQPKALARDVASVFETLNATPPGFLASFGLLALHAGSFLVALVMSGVLLVLQHRPA